MTPFSKSTHDNPSWQGTTENIWTRKHKATRPTGQANVDAQAVPAHLLTNPPPLLSGHALGYHMPASCTRGVPATAATTSATTRLHAGGEALTKAHGGGAE